MPGTDLLQRAQAAFVESGDRIGEAPRNAGLPAPEHAAWAQVATMLLNLSETINGVTERHAQVSQKIFPEHHVRAILLDSELRLISE